MVTQRAPTHWIDTNVMLEVYSHGDLYMDWGLSECTKPPGLNIAVDPEGRRVRMQGALWMAMVLGQLNAVSLTYQHENLRNILRLAPPDSEVGGWTSTILYVLGDGGMFRGWERLMTASGEGLSDRDRNRRLSDRDRDRLIVRACAPTPIVTPIQGITPEREQLMAEGLAAIRERVPGPLVLITRDRRLIREAVAAGIYAADPEAYSARTMTRMTARAMFEARLEQASSRYIALGPLDEWLLRVRAMDRVRKLYLAVWTPPHQPWFLHPLG